MAVAFSSFACHTSLTPDFFFQFIIRNLPVKHPISPRSFSPLAKTNNKLQPVGYHHIPFSHSFYITFPHDSLLRLLLAMCMRILCMIVGGNGDASRLFDVEAA